MDEIMNKELALVEVDSISDELSTFIEQGTETVINVLHRMKLLLFGKP